MGDLGVDTAVTALGDGRYTAQVSQEYEIWGPMGGYVASIALRAAGAEAGFHRPVSFFCHYLGVAAFDEVQLHVTKLRGGRNAESFRVSMHQGERAILEATVWTITGVEGLEHDLTLAPEVPGPDGLKDIRELLPDEEPLFPFWNNLDERPIGWHDTWPPAEALDPTWRQWLRFTPTATFDDPWIDACRSVVLVDVMGWPSAHQHHAWKWPNGQEWMAPNLDLYVAFHTPCPDVEWLLVDGHAPFAGEGLIAWNGRLWSADRRLVASGSGQLLCRRVPAVAPPAGA
jgi:acyl-CoA thioesterase-2